MTQQIPRRAAVGFVAVGAACAACARYGGPQFPGEGGTDAAAQQSTGEVLGKATDVPVGGGKVFEAQKLVVTQAEPGQFKAYSAVCPHQGCLVNEVVDGTINCPCHGSKFKLDGSVSVGPAQQALAPSAVSVNDYGELVTGGGAPAETTAPGGTTTAPETTGNTTAPGTTEPQGGGGDALAATADVPVGGGMILADKEIVITQPKAGEFKAFSAICTHQGCIVDEVSGGTINCPCHGSKFKLDGSVSQGPATAPLSSRAVKVSGDQISLA